jgi:hypothetical protein
MYELERDYNMEHIKERIKKEIYECKKIPEGIKRGNYKLLYVLFWIGMKLKDIGYSEKETEKLIMKVMVKIKLSSNYWDIAYNYVLQHQKKNKKIN